MVLRYLFLLMCFTALTQVAPATAQSRFSPAIQVGDAVVTYYQIEQRRRFLTLLGAPGDTSPLAREQLINEAVQMNAVRTAGQEPSPGAIEAGMTEFAGRANLRLEEFIRLVGQAGVEPETFRDFITAGVAWRDHVRGSFSSTARASISPTQIQRALARTGTEGGLRVLVSEVLLPATTPETALASRSRAVDVAALESEEAFAHAARQFSVAPSASRGGEQNWTALESLPDEVRGIIGALSPGQISRPVELGNSIGIFLLRDVERVASGTPETLSVDYALFTAGPDRASAAAVVDRIDTCDDLYAVAYGLPENRLIRETRQIGELAADIRNALGALDVDEATTLLARGGNSTVLMLCERKPGLESTVDFEIIGTRLLGMRLGSIAANHLANLRAETVIIDLAN